MTLKFFGLAIATAIVVLVQESRAEKDGGNDTVITQPLAISAAIDFGQVVKGWSKDPPANLDGQFLQRTGVWLTQRATVKERLDLTMGVGGMFWYALPEANGQPKSLVTRFGPGISQAFAVYKFGNVANPTATLQMGYFPYKYNPEARNLGEYLLRSGTYPGVLVSGGWNIISSAAYMMQGLKLHVPLWDGRFRSDFLLPMERDLPPMYSLSPTYVGSLDVMKGLEVGIGLSWNHGIPIKPSKESPKSLGNRIIVNRIVNPDTVAVGERAQNYYLYTYDSTEFYTFQGIKVGGRITLNPQAFVPMEILGEQDLKLYGEVAVLGWSNYSYFYEKRSERMPIMMGFNFPTFGLLDVLSIEVEHYGSKFENSMYEPYMSQTPVWKEEDPVDVAGFEGGYDVVAAAAAEQEKRIRDDNLKWTVYAKKQVFPGLRLYLQCANDHMRPRNSDAEPFWVPITNRGGKDWYYLMRLEFGI